MRNHNKDRKYIKTRNEKIIKRKIIAKQKKIGYMKINMNNYRP